MQKRWLKKCAWAVIGLLFLDTAAFADVPAAIGTQRLTPGDPTPIQSGGVPDNRQFILSGLDAPIDPDTYIIGPTDRFVLVVNRAGEKDMPLVVLPEGDVLLPSVGPLRAAGLTITEFRAALKTALSKYYRNVDFYCRLVTPRMFVVYVVGEVELPGGVMMTAPFRLDAAIRRAGGIKATGSHRAIEIRNADGEVSVVDLERFLLLAEAEHDPMLSEGQTVYVPARGGQCRVMGEVTRPDAYEIRDGETVADMIHLAGGMTPDAVSSRVTIERRDGENGTVVIATSGEGTETLKDGDVIVVPDRNAFSSRGYVRLEIGEARTRVAIRDDETIGSLAPRLVGLNRRQYDLARTVVERHHEDGSGELIPVDLDKVLTSGSGDLPLEPGDVISVPPLSSVVYVTGEVKVPGPIEFQHGMPVARYVALAGGPSSAGGFDNIVIFAADGSKRDGNRNSTVNRGDTIAVKRRRSVVFGTVFITLSSLTSLVLSVIAVTR